MAAHHSALEAARRREIEKALRGGELRAVVTSTSLELGVDIGTADVTVQIGLPGGVARCVQRVGRSGHRRGAGSRGILLAATPAEIAGAIITARAARAGRVEPLRMIGAPLDVVCQQLVSMACSGEHNAEQVFELFRKAGPMADLARADFDACLASLAGDLAAPPAHSSPSQEPPRGGLRHESGRARAGSAFAAGESFAGSGATSERFTPRRRCGSWTVAWPSARSRRRTPSD